MKKKIAIIPARSGSKGLQDKNIKILGGKPLLAYSIEAAIHASIFECIHVSTDSKEYAGIAREFGADVPFLRSEEMSSDTAGSWDVVREVLEKYRNKNKKFKSVCLLQPTSPLRNASDIIECYRLLEEKQGDSVTSVCEMEHSPLWSMKLDDSRSLKDYRKKSNDIIRQKIDQYYRINGAIYIRKILYTGNGITLLNNNEYAYVMNRRRSVDIDTIDDFEYAEFLLKRSSVPKN